MHIFISYAKVDTYHVAIQLRDELRKLPDVTVWMDETLEPGESWALQIQHEIDVADFVIVLLSPDVNRKVEGKQRRSFVLKEIDYAQAAGKPIIPIMAQATRMPVQIAGDQYIDFTGDHNKAMDGLIRTIARREGIVTNEVVEMPSSTQSFNALPLVNTTSDAGSNYRRYTLVIGIALIAIAILAAAILPSLNRSQSTPTLATSIAINSTDTPVPTKPLATSTPTISPTPAPTLTATPSLEIAQIVGTLDAQATVEQATRSAVSTDAALATANIVGTQSIVDQTSTATLWTFTPTPNITASIEAFRTQQAAIATGVAKTQVAQAQNAAATVNVQTTSTALAQATAIAIQVAQQIASQTAQAQIFLIQAATQTALIATQVAFSSTSLPEELTGTSQAYIIALTQTVVVTAATQTQDATDLIFANVNCVVKDNDLGNAPIFRDEDIQNYGDSSNQYPYEPSGIGSLGSQQLRVIDQRLIRGTSYLAVENYQIGFGTITKSWVRQRQVSFIISDCNRFLLSATLVPTSVFLEGTLLPTMSIKTEIKARTNIRSCAGIIGELLDYIPYPLYANVVAKTTTKDNELWYYIQYDYNPDPYGPKLINARRGWVLSDLLEFLPDDTGIPVLSAECPVPNAMPTP